LIDPHGKVEEIWPDVKAKGHAAATLARLSAL